MPGIQLDSGAVIGSIDELSEVGAERSISDGVARGGLLTVRGWLIDRASRKPPDTLALCLNSGPSVEAISGLPRPDVGAALGNNAALSGFVVAVPILAPVGRCSLWIRSRIALRESQIEIKGAVTVEPASDPFVDMTFREGGWLFCVDGVFTRLESPVSRDSSGAFIVSPEVLSDIRLWAIDAESLQPPQALIARFGGRYLRVTSTVAREDAALSLSARDARMCGFSIPLIASPIGTEQVEIYAIDSDGSYAHLTSVRARGSTSLSSDVLPETANISGALDHVSLDGSSVESLSVIMTRAGQELRLSGWTLDNIGPRLTGGVEVVIDEGVIIEGQTNIVRTDVAASMANRGITECGFDLPFSVPELRPGRHVLSVRALSARRDATAVLARRTLVVKRRNRKSQ